MSNLTSASGEATATATNYPQQYFSPSQSQTHDETPAKKRRNLPGNPGLIIILISSNILFSVAIIITLQTIILRP